MLEARLFHRGTQWIRLGIQHASGLSAADASSDTAFANELAALAPGAYQDEWGDDFDFEDDDHIAVKAGDQKSPSKTSG
ncbi:unnamed protein product, partial [Amoebophrya sp. A120]|eukprot:GSA120T00005351001.1